MTGTIHNRIADIPVILRDARSARVVAEARTDNRGQFEFSDLVPGTYRLEIDWKGRTWIGAKHLSLGAGFTTQAYMGWGTADCIVGR